MIINTLIHEPDYNLEGMPLPQITVFFTWLCRLPCRYITLSVILQFPYQIFPQFPASVLNLSISIPPGEASLVALTVIAVERYLTVIRPFNMGPLTYGRAVFAISRYFSDWIITHI